MKKKKSNINFLEKIRIEKCDFLGKTNFMIWETYAALIYLSSPIIIKKKFCWGVRTNLFWLQDHCGIFFPTSPISYQFDIFTHIFWMLWTLFESTMQKQEFHPLRSTQLGKKLKELAVLPNMTILQTEILKF